MNLHSYPKSDVAQREFAFRELQEASSDRLRSTDVAAILGGRAALLASLIESAEPVGLGSSQILLPREHDPAVPQVLMVRRHELGKVVSASTQRYYQAANNTEYETADDELTLVHYPVCRVSMSDRTIPTFMYIHDDYAAPDVQVSDFAHETEHWRFFSDPASNSLGLSVSFQGMRAYTESVAYGVSAATSHDNDKIASAADVLVCELEGSLPEEAAYEVREAIQAGLATEDPRKYEIAGVSGVIALTRLFSDPSRDYTEDQVHAYELAGVI